MLSPPESAEKLGAVGVACGVAGAGAMLPYLEIMHTESLSRRFCLIMQNILWNLFGTDGPT